MGFWDWLMGTPPQERTSPPRRTSNISPTMNRTTVFGIEVGDVVAYDEVDYLVKNKLTYEEDGFHWYDYLLVDDTTGRECWLSAEDDDGVSVGIYREIDLDSIPPVPRQLTYEGASYRCTENSYAQVRLEREDPSRDTDAGRVEYWDFEAAGDKYLSVLRWGNSFEASVGREIQPHELTIYPAGVA
ncbi:MAG: DUF4178 domain-containing protein [Candidatus Sericytochromatia bacterium]|nr:DUF4178 domain-containing protein [Candidatus Sericytochromatia bacterium]